MMSLLWCIYIFIYIYIYIYIYDIVSSRVGTPCFWGNPPAFLGTPSFWSKFKKLPPSFWEPSKLVHVNCMKHFKKVLRFVLYYVSWEYHYHYSLYFQAQLCIYYWHLLWLDIAFNVFHIWHESGMNMKHF